MVIKEFNELNEDLINSIRILEKVCKEYDGLNVDMFLDNSLNFNKNINNLFMAYEDDNLVSVLYMFIPTKSEAELSAYTHPIYRKKGYFKALLHRAKEEVTQYGIEDLLFVCESQSKDGKEVINKFEASYSSTEYLLKFNKDSKNLVSTGITMVRKALGIDVEKIIDICIDAFDDSYEVAESFTVKALEAEDREIYVSELSNEIVGVCSVYYDGDDIVLFGLAISKDNQGKGLGKDTLRQLVKSLYEDGKKDVLLEVDSENDVAFNLYKKCGFETKTAIEYHRKSL